MLATLVITVGLVVILGLVFGRGGRLLAARARHNEHLADKVETLDYVVPEGQDPAVLLIALENAGVDAAPGHENGRQVVHINCAPDDTVTREKARAVIEGVDTTMPDAGVPIDPRPVRFVGEH